MSHPKSKSSFSHEPLMRFEDKNVIDKSQAKKAKRTIQKENSRKEKPKKKKRKKEKKTPTIQSGRTNSASQLPGIEPGSPA